MGEDEGSPNPMSLDELEQRMRDWLKSGWHIDLLCIDKDVVGYALYRFRQNEYFPDRCNPIGKSFWHSVGFVPYSTTMKLV